MREEPSTEHEILTAMEDHHENERQKLQEVKSAFQLLKKTGDKRGRIKKSKMSKILHKLGLDTILEVVKKKGDHYSISIMDQVNLCADYWLQQAEHTPLVEFHDGFGSCIFLYAFF